MKVRAKRRSRPVGASECRLEHAWPLPPENTASNHPPSSIHLSSCCTPVWNVRTVRPETDSCIESALLIQKLPNPDRLLARCRAIHEFPQEFGRTVGRSADRTRPLKATVFSNGSRATSFLEKDASRSDQFISPLRSCAHLSASNPTSRSHRDLHFISCSRGRRRVLLAAY